ncbi:MAG: AsmA family protein [Planctomycetota bacterium]|jgi:hypothetical protein
MTGENTEQKKSRPKSLKVVKWVLILSAGIVLLIFFGFPMFLSSSGGTNFLLSKINQAVDGQVQMDDFSIGWFRGIKLVNLSYVDGVGDTSVTVEKIQTQPKYLSLLGGKVNLGKTVVDRPRIHLKVPLEQGDVEGAETVSAKSDAPPPVFPVNQIDLEVIDGAATIELTGDVPQTVSFANIASTVQIAEVGKPSSVDFSMNVDDTSKISAKGTATPSKTGWTLEGGDYTIQISKLQLASLKPLLALAGQDMDMSGEVNADATVQIEQNQIRQLKADAVVSDFTQGVGDQQVVFEKPIVVSTKAGQRGETLEIDTLKIESEFCNVVCGGTLEEMSYAIDADLAQMQQIIEPFTDMAGVSIAGALTARGRVGMTDERVHLTSEDSKIRQLKVLVPDSEPFIQDQVTLDADILVDMANQTIDVRTLDLQGKAGESLISITKGAVKKKVSNTRTQLTGDFEAEYDWQVLSAFASAYLPEGLIVKGKRKDAFNFASEYPTDIPDLMFANLDAGGAVGFGSAEYFGLSFGPTELKMNIRKGILDFEIPEATVNEGKLQFAGSVDLNEEPKVLRLQKAMPILENIHINNQMTDTMLKYLNPVFARQGDISGFASLMCKKLEIPFNLDEKNNIVLDGVVQMDNVRLKATGLVGDILAKTSNRSEFKARLLPSRILLQKGVMQYDEMEFHLDEYPTGFSGKIYLDKTLDMEVFVPYKFDVDRLRFPTVKIGEDLSDRLSLPVEGTVDKPQVRLEKLFDSIMKKHTPELIQKGIEELLKNL